VGEPPPNIGQIDAILHPRRSSPLLPRLGRSGQPALLLLLLRLLLLLVVVVVVLLDTAPRLYKRDADG
jgi:hypothetical protein